MNPTLKGMKKMIETKEKAYDLAKREYYPDFNFKFAYGQRDSTPEWDQPHEYAYRDGGNQYPHFL